MHVVIEVNGDIVPGLPEDGHRQLRHGELQGVRRGLDGRRVSGQRAGESLQGDGRAGPDGDGQGQHRRLSADLRDLRQHHPRGDEALPVVAEGYSNRSNQAPNPGANLNYCAESAPTPLVKADRDLDGVGNSTDACPNVAPTATQESVRGCPAVFRDLTASYAAGVVSGTVTTRRPPPQPLPRRARARCRCRCATPRPRHCWHRRPRRTTASPRWRSARRTRTAPLMAQVGESNYQGQALCLRAVSAVVDVVRDGDGDGWRDLVDTCPDVKPRIGVGVSLGCPIVQRTITASYADGVVSGVVRLVRPEGWSVPADVCAAHTRLEVWSLDDNDNEVALLAKGNHSTQDGGYAIEVHLAVATPHGLCPRRGQPGRRHLLGGLLRALVRWRLRPMATPTTMASGTWMIACDEAGGSVRPDGCPDVDRVLTEVEYADGVLSGVVQVEDSSVTGCSGADEVEVRSGDTVVASGSAPARTGVFGVQVRLVDNSYYALVLEERLDPAAGWCAPAGAPLASAVDTDGDEVRDFEDACDELDGKRDKDPRPPGARRCRGRSRCPTPSYDHPATVSAGPGRVSSRSRSPCPGCPTRARARTWSRR